jgi:WD40 repeat protein
MDTPFGENAVRIFDIVTGRERYFLEGDTSIVLGVAMSADGAMAISFSGDRSMRIWDKK